MIKNEDTYCIVQHKIVRELGAWEAVVYGTIVNLLRKTDGIGEVSNQTIMDLCGIGNKMSLFRYINKLIESGYIEKREGKGRGNISIYYITKKGNNLLPISEKKGNKNDTEKVTKMNEKGNNLLPINKGIIKEINKGGETPTPIMEDFEIFWKAFPGSPEFDYDKEKCEKVWSLMCEEWRAKLIAMAQNGLRWRTKENDKPIFYLRDYAGQDAHVVLPFVRQGSKTFARFISDHEGKDTICIFRYEGSLAYCLEDAKQQMIDAGAEFIRNF